MKFIALYVLQVIAASGILYLYYHFFLRNKKFHQYNRYYLLLAIIVSISIPFVSFPVYFTNHQAETSVVIRALKTVYYSEQQTTIDTTSTTPNISFNWNVIIFSIYASITIILLGRIFFFMRRLKHILDTNTKEVIGDINFLNTTEPGTPFSFFNWLFWNRNIKLESEKGQQIFRHEIYHIKQKHSWDVLFVECISRIFWINPFFHLIKKEIKIVHEFLADDFASKEANKWEYAELLVMQVLQTNNKLITPFFHTQIKRRIAMITNSQKTSYRYVRKLLALPMIAIAAFLISFTYKNKKGELPNAAKETITVVIDAAHGGSDNGALSIDKQYSEKEFTLSLANEIKKLSESYNVNVILTRDNDALPKNAMTPDEGLRKRIEIAKESGAELYLSLHTNSAPARLADKSSGMEIYISSKKENSRNERLASSLIQSLSGVYKISPVIKKRRDAGIYVLDANVLPSALIEFGFITNADDLAFISDKNNQEKMAQKVLEAIVNYKEAKTETSSATIENTNGIASIDTIPGADGKIFEKVEVPVQFIGGNNAMEKFLDENIDQTIPVKSKAPKGIYTVYIQFVVKRDGSISDIKGLTKHGYGMEKEAIRVLKTTSNKWTPAIVNGKLVTSYARKPVTFRVS